MNSTFKIAFSYGNKNMRKALLFFISFFWLSAVCANQNIKIAINPGHGIIFNGESWEWQRKEYHGVREDLLTPEFAIILNNLLKQENFSTLPLRELDKSAGIGDSGLDKWKESSRDFLRSKGDVPEYVWNTIRTSDLISQDIYSRVLYADFSGADILINIHTNGSIAGDLTGDGDKTGTLTVVCSKSENINNSESLELAKNIHESVIEEIKQRFDENWLDVGIITLNRGENCLAESPAIIIELAYHDQSFPDAVYLKDNHFRQVAAEGMKMGIKEFFSVQSDALAPDFSSSPKIFADNLLLQFEVTWDAVIGANSYRLYRCADVSISSCKEIYSGNQSNFIDEDISINTHYYYRSKSCNLGGCDISFSEYGASILEGGNQTSDGGGTIELIWLISMLLMNSYRRKILCYIDISLK